MFQARGFLRYRPGWWATIEVGGDIASYYRTLLPREWNVRPGRDPHVTVVRGEEPPDKTLWGSREGHEIAFFYEPGLKWNDHFYWLRVFSLEIERVRTELGLSVLRQPGWNAPPPGFAKYFHLTVGEGR